MYLLTWNQEDARLEATFGGSICKKEVDFFSEDFRSLLKLAGEAPFTVLLDYATTTKLAEGVAEILSELRDESVSIGATRVTVIARDEPEANALAAERVAQVTSGREEYVAYGLAA
jgi:hypothetical protein